MKSHCVSFLSALRPEAQGFPYQIPSHSARVVRPQGDWCAVTVGQKLLRWDASTGSPGGPDRPTRATPPGRSALGLAGWPGRCSERRREEPGAPATQNHRAQSPAAVAALTAARARCLHGALHSASRIRHAPGLLANASAHHGEAHGLRMRLAPLPTESLAAALHRGRCGPR